MQARVIINTPLNPDAELLVSSLRAGAHALILKGGSNLADDISRIRRTAADDKRFAAVIVELAGQRFRISTNEALQLKAGQEINFRSEGDVPPQTLRCPAAFHKIPFEENQLLSADSGRSLFRVTARTETQLSCRVVEDTLLPSGAWLDAEADEADLPAFCNEDYELIDRAVDLGADYFLLPPGRSQERQEKILAMINHRVAPQRLILQDSLPEHCDRRVAAMMINETSAATLASGEQAAAAKINHCRDLECEPLLFLKTLSAAQQEMTSALLGAVAESRLQGCSAFVLQLQSSCLNDKLAAIRNMDFAEPRKKAGMPLTAMAVRQAASLMADHIVVISDHDSVASSLMQTSIQTTLVTGSRESGCRAALMPGVRTIHLDNPDEYTSRQIVENLQEQKGVSGRVLCLFHTRSVKEMPDTVKLYDL